MTLKSVEHWSNIGALYVGFDAYNADDKLNESSVRLNYLNEN